MIGASAILTDPARGFRADQWARFCGRHQTAEMIETTARSKLLEKSSSNKWNHDSISISRSKTTSAVSQTNGKILQSQTTTHSGGYLENSIHESNFVLKIQNYFAFCLGFRSKFRKVFPSFGFTMKDKQKDGKLPQNGFVNVTDVKNNDDKLNGDIVNYLTAAALCVGGSPAINASNKQLIKSFCRPLEVPK
jgi:hypothetical protein